jgi:conjugative relaxase-like TrwC/TraI family protein
VAEVRSAALGQDPHQVPYFDLTVDVVKSVSVLHASYRVAARQAGERGDHAHAALLDKQADQIEAAVLDAARDAVAWLERHATYTRTGHHSARTGEWRDGAGLVASVFLHHISRDGDPHLHVHIAVWNRVQRADRADEKWRTLDSRSLHHQRLGVAPVTARGMETRLSALGYALVPRADGNGAEVGGVSQDVMETFSSRSRALTPELKTLIGQYQKIHGKPPSKRTIWLLGQQAAQNTRRTKAEAHRTVAGGKRPGKPGPRWSGAGSRRAQPDSGKPGRNINHRPWWSGGVSSKRTSPQWIGPSSVSTGPRSPRASPGRPGAAYRRRPRAPRRIRS